MSVFRCRDKWRAKVYVDGTAVASQSGFDSKKEARAWHDAIKFTYDRDAIKAAAPRTFDDLVAKYQADHLGKKSAGTQRRYQLEIDSRIAPFFRFVPVEKLTLDLLDGFRDQLGKTLEPKQANFCLSLLSSILNRGVRWRWLTKGHRFEMFDVPVRDYQWWDDQAFIARFLQMAQSRSRFYRLYYTALATGMREGELVGLYKSDIDFDRGRINVQRKWDLASKAFGRPKHNKARWLDFDPAGDLGRILKEACDASQVPDLVFPAESGGPLGRNRFADRTFRTLTEDAGVPVIRFHDLRHTFASWYMIQQDNVWSLKEILGHADIKTTMRYAHHSAKQRKAPLDLQSVIAHKSPTDSAHLVVGL